MTFTVQQGDALALLRAMPEASIQCCVTSPPYWGLRDYGSAGQIGLEESPDAYVARIVDVFRAVRRVLRKDGTLWLNLGDCYATGAGKVGDQPGGGEQGARWKGEATRHRDARRRRRPAIDGRGAPQDPGKFASVGPMTQPNRMPIPGLKPKDLVGIPWRVAFALQADGWWLRSDIVWSKPNAMPESVTDRPTKAHEYLFLLAASERYVYNAAEVAETATNRVAGNLQATTFARVDPIHGRTRANLHKIQASETRNRRSVWTIASQPFPGAHFAVMPEALVEPCILAGTRPGDVVLDPFAGSGTVGVVALRHGRRFVGLELNPEYVAMARSRIGGPLFAEARP